MEEQRVAHNEIRAIGAHRSHKGNAPAPAASESHASVKPQDVQRAEPQVPKIELF